MYFISNCGFLFTSGKMAIGIFDLGYLPVESKFMLAHLNKYKAN
jgi:hypothetical protein